MASQSDLYNSVIRAGGTPTEARYLAAIAMAESGGRSVKSSVDPNSWGPWQINLDAHPQYTVEQAMDPQIAATIALSLARARGSFNDWSMYTNGGYEQYLGGDMDITDIPPGPGTIPRPSSSSLPPEIPDDDYIRNASGLIVGYWAVNDYGEDVEKYFSEGQIRAINGQQSASASGSLLPTQIPGLFINPNTGATIDTRTQGGAPVTDVTTRPIAGTDLLGMYSQDGRYLGSTQAPKTDVRDVSARPIAGTDTSGLFDQDGNYIGSTATPRYGTQVKPVGDTGLYTVTDADGRIYNVGGKYTSDYDKGIDTRNFGEDKRRFDVNQTETVRQFDANLSERIAQRQQNLVELNAQLASAEKRDQAKISAEIQMQSAKLANDMAIAQMDVGARLKIAGIQAAVEGRGQDVTQRGQDIQANVSYRGQDIQREGNILEATNQRAMFAAQTLGKDPIRQAIFLTGGSGGTTPLEQFAQSYAVPRLPNVRDSQNVAQVQPVNFSAKGSVIRSNEPVLSVVGDDPRRPAEAALLAPGSVVMPMNLPAGASKSDMQKAAQRLMPVMQEKVHMMADGGGVHKPLPDIGTLNNGGEPFDPFKPPAGEILNPEWTAWNDRNRSAIQMGADVVNPLPRFIPAPTADSGFTDPSKTDLDYDAKKKAGIPTGGPKDPAEIAKLGAASQYFLRGGRLKDAELINTYLAGTNKTRPDDLLRAYDAAMNPPLTPSAGGSMFDRPNLGGGAPAETEEQKKQRISDYMKRNYRPSRVRQFAGWGDVAKPPQPAVQPAPRVEPPQLRPEDVLLSGVTPTSQAGLDAARKTVSDALRAAMYGPTTPEFGALPKVQPIYGVDLRQPEELASTFFNRPGAQRDLVTSGWGVRDMPEDEFYRRMQAATPSAVRPFNVQYARRGITVVPVRRVA